MNTEAQKNRVALLVGEAVEQTREDIAARDAYPKKTCYWVGNGFVMPPKKPVYCPPGYSKQHTQLGGKSAKTKRIRSMSPRGIAAAIYEANAKPLP